MNSCLVGMKRILENSKQNDMSAKKVAKVVKPTKVVKPIKAASDGIPDLEPLTPEQVDGIAEMARMQHEEDMRDDELTHMDQYAVKIKDANEQIIQENLQKLIGKFLIEAQLDKESRYTIMVGGPKNRVVIERFGIDPKIVFSRSLIEAIQKISG